MKYQLLILFVLCASTYGKAQDDEEKQRIVEQRIEFIGENLEDSDVDFTTYFDDLFFFFDTPLNLNTASFEEFQRLHLLSDVQIQSIINYRTSFGDLLSIYELGAIEELDPQIIEMITPFVQVEKVEKDDFKWKNAIKYGKHEIITRYERVIQEKEGYIEKPDSVLAENPNRQYLGSPDKFYVRYRNRYKDRLSFGVTMEKDAGEEFFRGSQEQGFDYYSAHLYATKVWKFKEVALGDYQVNFGQGLTMWSSFALGKSADVMSGKRFGNGIRPYTSVNETQFLRGGAFSLGNDNWNFTGFASYKGIDANIIEPDTLNNFFDARFSSFQRSGFHRTPGELEDKNSLQEFVTGGELAYSNDKLRIGIIGVYTQYDQELAPSSRAYQRYKFSGRELFTGGVNYRLYHKKMVFFGETAMSDNMKMGTINGVSWHADSRLDFMVIYRHFDKEFQSIYSAAFSESSDNTGETGLYFGAEARLTKWLSISAFYDQYNINYLSWLTDDDSEGRDFFLQANIKLNRRNKFYIRYRNDLSERNSKDDEFGIKGQVDLQKHQFRIHFDHDVNSQIRLKSRVEYINFRYGDQVSHGILLFQDIRYKFRSIPMSLYARYAMFDSDNYDARIYAYENDLLYVFSIPSYFYRGIRTYLMAKIELGSRVDMWLRYGIWSYGNVDNISSGLEEIDGSLKSDVKLQLKIRL